MPDSTALNDASRREQIFLQAYLASSTRRLSPDEVMECLLTSLSLKLRQPAS